MTLDKTIEKHISQWLYDQVSSYSIHAVDFKNFKMSRPKPPQNISE